MHTQIMNLFQWPCDLDLILKKTILYFVATRGGGVVFVHFMSIFTHLVIIKYFKIKIKDVQCFTTTSLIFILKYFMIRCVKMDMKCTDGVVNQCYQMASSSATCSHQQQSCYLGTISPKFPCLRSFWISISRAELPFPDYRPIMLFQ